MKNTLLSIFIILITISTRSLYGELCGKVEGGPAFVHIDILASGKTVHRMNMAAFKGDATIILKKGYGFALKPTFLYGKTSGKEYLISGGLGIGHCTPIKDWLTITPSFGVNFTYVRTKTSILAQGLKNLKEIFWSASPYIGLDGSLSLGNGWRFVGVFQYSISRTHTNIPKILYKEKSQTQGPNYAVLIEKDITDKFSINIGAAYNLSLSKERHGLRGMGGKVSVAYWF